MNEKCIFLSLIIDEGPSDRISSIQSSITLIKVSKGKERKEKRFVNLPVFIKHLLQTD